MIRTYILGVLRRAVCGPIVATNRRIAQKGFFAQPDSLSVSGRVRVVKGTQFQKLDPVAWCVSVGLLSPHPRHLRCTASLEVHPVTPQRRVEFWQRMRSSRARISESNSAFRRIRYTFTGRAYCRPVRPEMRVCRPHEAGHHTMYEAAAHNTSSTLPVMSLSLDCAPRQTRRRRITN